MASRFVTRQMTTEMRPELELVLRCARWQIDSATTDRVRVLLGGDLNWPEVVANAIRHRVTPTLYEVLVEIGADLISPSWQQSLREVVQVSAKNSFILLREMLRLYQLFEMAQIPAVPYKGPVLASLAYRSFSRREYSDLDFAMPQKYIPEATAVLLAAGFSAGFDLREAHAGQQGFAPGQYFFTLDKQCIPVELHTERTLRYFPVPLEFQDLNRRMICVEIAGRSLQTFSVEDTLLMLCVHGAKHFWDRLSWIVDVAELITVQSVDWSLSMQIAAEAKSMRVLMLGLYLAHDLLGASLPKPVLERAQQDPGVRWLAEKVVAQFERNTDASPGVVPRAVFRLRSRDEIGQGMLHTLRLAMSPTESDRQIVRLPAALVPLYVFMRPLRLLREYGLGFRRRLKPNLAIDDLKPQDVTVDVPTRRLAPESPLNTSGRSKKKGS
jgi:hypothetical protein